jgi:site-specific DNA-methyltransferase (adenine-specific)
MTFTELYGVQDEPKMSLDPQNEARPDVRNLTCFRCHSWDGVRCECADGQTLLCGDNCEILRTFPDDCIDLIVTSPPYDNLRTYGGHSWDFEGLANQLWRVVKPGGVVVWVVADATVNGSETGTSFRQALRFMEIGFRLHDTMIYQKGNWPFPESARYNQVFEFCFVFSIGSPVSFNQIKDRKTERAGEKIHGTQRTKTGELIDQNHITRKTLEYGARTNVWVYFNGRNTGTKDAIAFGHPAQFPEALARDHILSWSNEGDIVLDPFNGSGTTTKMARKMGRRGIGLEINPEYCEIAKERLRQKEMF